MTASTKTVVFIDPNVADWQDLVNGVEPGSLVFILDPQRDGISQITNKLAALTDINSVQIISHGGDGSLQLGSTQLNSDNLNGYSSQLQQWGKSLASTGDILLYGCNVAQGVVGKAFVQQISQLTGADVAASDDLTGSAALGGDWVLEYATGLIEAPLALQVQAMEAYSSTFTFTLVGEFLTRAYGVQVVGNYAYVANAYSGLQIIDISNPTTPSLKGNYDTSDHAWGVQVMGNYAYVADGESGLQIIDISNPTTPILKGNYNTSGTAFGVQVVGNYAYVADTSSGLQIIDISNPTTPILKGNYNTSGFAGDVQVVGNYAYVADGFSGLQIIDISNPTTPILKGNYDTSGHALGVQVVGRYAYVADYASGLQIIDISNPTTPILKGNYDTPDAAWGVQVVGNYAYVADVTSGLQIIDISNPTTPILKGNYDTSGTATVGVQVVGNYAYVADQFHGLSIINVDDTFLEYNGSRYLLTGQGTWEQTQAQAESLGGNLVTVNNQAEQDWLVTSVLIL